MSIGFDIGDALAKLQDWLTFLDEKEQELTGNLQRMSGKEDSDALMPTDGDALMPTDGDALTPADGDALTPADGDALVSTDDDLPGGDLPVEDESEDPWDL